MSKSAPLETCWSSLGDDCSVTTTVGIAYRGSGYNRYRIPTAQTPMSDRATLAEGVETKKAGEMITAETAATGARAPQKKAPEPAAKQ